MKTLKLTLAVIALLFVGVAANAATTNTTKTDVINMYINAVANGKVQGLDQILDNDMQFNTQRGNNITSINKNMFLDYMNKNTASGTPINTSTTVMQGDDNSEKVKIDFKYDGFTRTDVVTLSRTTGWVITGITSSSK